jgi:hypothetical protein
LDYLCGFSRRRIERHPQKRLWRIFRLLAENWT